MLRARILSSLLFLFVVLSFAFPWLRTGESSVLLRRVTHTPEGVINLNPALSGDGRHVAFESSEDLANAGSGQGFHALHATLDTDPATFSEIARTRFVAPGLSQDGSAIAFTSTEDLVGHNADKNPEIFLKTGANLKQITATVPETISTRLNDGSFQPSISDDAQVVVFSSNRNLVGQNGDLNLEVFLFAATTETLTQITDTVGTVGSSDPKLSGDGSHVAYISDDSAVAGSERDLLLYSRITGETRTIAADVQALALTYGRAISDNGSRVVYSFEPAQNESEVFLFDAASGDSRQVTALGKRVSEVSLNPTISGDGKRIAFAARRRVTAASDGSVELYVYDIPSNQFIQLTDAPASATAEVVSSLNDDGSLAAFNFPRVLLGAVSSGGTANTCEIFLASIPSRPTFAPLAVVNGASPGNEPAPLPRGGIVIGQGNALAVVSLHGRPTDTGSFPFSLGGTTVTVNGHQAQVLYVSATEVNFVIPSEVSPGTAEIVITNADGFQSRTDALIANAAPGIFTSTGDGRGPGIVLDADKLVSGPFDPTGGQLRLSVFATGVRHANSIFSRISGQEVTVEAVIASPDLPGLDEIHLLVPEDLRGAGDATLTLVADALESNRVTVTLGGSHVRDIVINEILADPPDGLPGDANRDGTRSASEDEFVELVNATTRGLDLAGFQVQTRSLSGVTDIVRHRFAVGTILPAGTALVIFGGGSLNPSNPVFAGARLLRASSGGLSLSNAGGVIILREASGTILTSVQFGTTPGLAADDNQSLTRFPDITGSFTLHKLAPESSQRAYSPGTRVSGAPFP